MVRLPGVVVPGCPLHVIQRGNNRQAMFFVNQDSSRFCNDSCAVFRRADPLDCYST